MNSAPGGLPVSGTHLKRRLTAILAADACGHSRLDGRRRHGPDMIDKADGTDSVASPVIGWRTRLLEQLKRFKGPVIAIASVGAVLSGLVGYWNVYRTVAVATPTSTAATTAPASPYSLSVAVMPFIAADPRPTDAALADALSQSLAMALGQTRTFKVAAPGHVHNDAGQGLRCAAHRARTERALHRPGRDPSAGRQAGGHCFAWSKPRTPRNSGARDSSWRRRRRASSCRICRGGSRGMWWMRSVVPPWTAP